MHGKTPLAPILKIKGGTQIVNFKGLLGSTVFGHTRYLTSSKSSCGWLLVLYQSLPRQEKSVNINKGQHGL